MGIHESWFVYILECKDGSFYTGVTKSLEKRMKLHKDGKGSKYVKIKGFKKLLFSKECKNRSSAQKEESYIKTLPKYEKLSYCKLSLRHPGIDCFFQRYDIQNETGLYYRLFKNPRGYLLQGASLPFQY